MPGPAIDSSQHHHIKDEDETLGENGCDEYTYKPRPQLPKPFVFMRSLADLIKDLDNNLIDVDPEYQREVVWTADRMTGLIDSLMENFYIPPIILNKATLADKSKPAVHICVDGKQRLSSVRAFVKGMIPCHDHQGEKWWFCNTPSSRRKKVLPEETQKMFLRKELVSFEFRDLLPDQEEDLFARVQMGVQLSPAEKMRASTGPWQELARLFVDDFPIIYSLMKDRARAKDFQLTLSCFSQIVEVMHPTAPDGLPHLKTSYTALPKLLSNKAAVDDGLKSHLASVWNTFKELVELDPDTFTNTNKYLRGVQTFAPIEMVAVTVLISMYSDTRNNRLLLGDIKSLREAIREIFTDIKQNKREWTFIWRYLEDLEAIRGAVDGSTVDRRVQQPTNATTHVTIPGPQLPPASRESDAEKRRGLTDRSKTPKILPPQEPFTLKKEGFILMDIVDPPRPKRQRTDPGPISPPTSIVEQPSISTRITHYPEQPFGPLGAQLAQFAYQQPQYPPIPTHASVSPIVDQPTQASSSSGTISPAFGTAPQSWSMRPIPGGFQPPLPSLHTRPAPHGSSTIQHPSAPAVHSVAGLGLNDYEASTAHMTSAAPMTSMQQTPMAHMTAERSWVAMSSTSLLGNLSCPRTPKNSIATLRTGRGACSPKYTKEQWAGEVRSATPPRETAYLPSTKRRKGQKAPHAPPRPTVAQCDGAIDLTNDTEQERQDLLSSFKATALANRTKQLQQQNAASQGAPSETSRPYISDQDATPQNVPVRDNNPWAEFKDGANTS